ncbi:MAG TPA: DUF6152 family protein [Gammaproteobacteria bacterium]|nr:DUF6152 family protein [Gammaproteobacteria bacterium]
MTSHSPRRTDFFLATVVIAFTVPATAHHGIGRFDPSGELTVEGTLTGLDFVNPHSYVYFDTVDADGAVVEMQCEMRAATVLRRSGWSPDMFVPGVAIRIVGRPHRDDPHYCHADALTIGDTPTLERYQQLGDEAPIDRSDRPYRLPSGVPNLAGDWAQEQYIMARPPEGPANLVPKSLLEAVESGEVSMEDVPDHGWFPPPVTLTEAGQAASEALRDLSPEQNPRLSCQITSILFDWVFDGTINRITQGEDVITMAYGRGLERTVYMNINEHSAGIAPSRAGHSIGRWDGDTLVVDTVGFEPGSLAGAVPHSGELRVVERFTLDPATLALRRDYVATDPVSFMDEYVGSDTVLPADAPFAVDACKELAYEYQPEETN